MKVGESLKCVIIETNNNDYKWRAYPFIEEWNQSSNLTLVSDFGLTLPKNDSDFLCYRFNQLSSDINTIKTEIRFNPSNLETYLIPPQLTDILEKKKSLTSYCPQLDGALNSENYGKRYHTLLYLEEYQNQRNLKKYNLCEVTLEKEGSFFAIQVPSLAEGRPSLILGDRVLLFREPIRFRHKSVRYVGFVKEVQKVMNF